MLSKIRLLLIGLFIIVGITLHLKVGLTPAWYLYLAAVILLLTHFLFNSVWAAFTLLRQGKILEAETLLNTIQKPEWLAKSSRAYYYFIKGMIAVQKKDIDNAKIPLEEALKLGLRNDKDSGFALLNLGHIAFIQKQFEDAKSYLMKLKALKINDLILKENISELEKALSEK